MKIERTKNASQNIFFGILLRLQQTLLPFLMRTVMLHYMGVQYLGLNSLFSSILHILNLAELGVGSAMVFSMYKPIAEDDEVTICALMRLYRRYYRLIGLLISVIGLVLTPVIPHLISGDIPSELNIYVLYWLNLGATVLTYWLFAYKNCLLQAHQRTDKISAVTMITGIVQCVIQLIVLIFIRNYYAYLIVALAVQALNNVCTAVVAGRMYPQYRPHGNLSREKTKEISKRIRDLFTSKLGNVIINSCDSTVISAFLGLSVLAIYQNYFFILTAVIGMIDILLQSVIAGLGNSFITETTEKNYNDLKKFTFLFMWLTGVCTCCFLGLYQPFMEIWTGKELMLENAAVICFAIYFWVYTASRLLNVYKDAAGLWHEDRFRPLVTAFVNLGLNLLWVKPLGIYGVLLSTVVSIVILSLPWLLRNVFTVLFPRKMLWDYVGRLIQIVAAVCMAGALVWLLCLPIQGNPLVALVLRGLVSVTVSNLVFWLILHKSRQFAPAVEMLDQLTKNKLKLAKRLLRKKS